MRELLRLWKLNVALKGHVPIEECSIVFYSGIVNGVYGQVGSGRTILRDVILGRLRAQNVAYFVRRELLSFDEYMAFSKQIWCIPEDTAFVQSMTVWENMMLGPKKNGRTEIFSKFAYIRRLQQDFDQLGVEIDPSVPMHALTVADQYILEIYRAWKSGARIIMFADLSGALSQSDYFRLRDFMHALLESGLTFIVFCTKLNGLQGCADNISVMNEGTIINTSNNDPYTLHTWQEELPSFHYTSESNPVALTMRNIELGNGVTQSFDLRYGEISVLFDPVGTAGKCIRQRMIYGIGSGEIYVDGTLLRGTLSYEDGVYFADFFNDGSIVESLSPLANICLPKFRKLKAGQSDSSNKYMKCVADEFTQWYGDRSLIEKKKSDGLSFEERLAIMLFRYILIRPKILICSTLDKGIEKSAQSLVTQTLDFLAQKIHTAVCVINTDYKSNAMSQSG